jgi:hypothetical protein
MTKITLKMVLILGVLAVLIVSVAGCTSSTNSSQTPSATTQHDAFLDKFLTAYKDTQYSNKSREVHAWELDWINSTSARLQYTILYKPSNFTNTTVAYDVTFMVFTTSQYATNYVNAINTTAYSLASTVYTDSPGGLAYQNVTGHAPQVFKGYQWNVGSYETNEIKQADNIVWVDTVKTLS